MAVNVRTEEAIQGIDGIKQIQMWTIRPAETAATPLVARRWTRTVAGRGRPAASAHPARVLKAAQGGADPAACGTPRPRPWYSGSRNVARTDEHPVLATPGDRGSAGAWAS